MPETQVVCFTRTEYEAFNLTFDSLKRALVCGPDRYRVADPFGKIAHLFRTDGDGERFIAKLVQLRLFEDAVAGGPNGSIPSYVACQHRWLDFVSCIKVVPDPPSPPAPPFRTEEKALVAAREDAERRRSEIELRREVLAQELQAAESALAQATADIVEIDGLLKEVRAVGERVKRFVCGATAPPEASA